MAVPVLMGMAQGWFFRDFRSWGHDFGSQLIPWSVVFLGLSLFYMLAPHRPTRFAEVWAAALFATVVLRAGESLFVIYLRVFRHAERGVRGVWRDHGVAAVDILFRMRYDLWRLPVRRTGRSARTAGGIGPGAGGPKG